MRDEQRNSPDAIDRILTRLAGVEAPTGMEQRVLQAVQRRAAERKPSRLASLSSFVHGRPWAVAACVVVISVAASVAARKRHQPRHEDAFANRHSSPVTTVASRVEVAETRPRQPVLTASARKKNLSAPDVPSDEEALAISEMNAPSKPAPPLPLTHQERLLAEAVHQDNPAELSSLRPEVRDRQIELSKAEFHNFFEPPPAKDNE